MKYTPPFKEKGNTIIDSKDQVVMTFEQEDAEQRVEELVILLNLGWNYIKLIGILGISPYKVARLYLHQLNE